MLLSCPCLEDEMGKRSTQVIINYFICTWVLNCISLTLPTILCYLFKLLTVFFTAYRAFQQTTTSCLLPSPDLFLSPGLEVHLIRISFSRMTPPESLKHSQLSRQMVSGWVSFLPQFLVPLLPQLKDSFPHHWAWAANVETEKKKILNTTRVFTICLKSLLFLTLFLFPLSSQSSRKQAEVKRGTPPWSMPVPPIPFSSGPGLSFTREKLPKPGNSCTHGMSWLSSAQL